MNETKVVILNQYPKMTIKVPNEYICPITHGVMKCPVATTAGSTYEAVDIAKWISLFEGQARDPMQPTAILERQLIFNTALYRIIGEFWAEQRDKFKRCHTDKINNPENPKHVKYKKIYEALEEKANDEKRRKKVEAIIGEPILEKAVLRYKDLRGIRQDPSRARLLMPMPIMVKLNRY